MRARERADERQAHDDDNHTEHPGEDVRVFEEEQPRHPTEHRDGHEHQSEPGNEQRHPAEQPSTGSGGVALCRGGGEGGPEVAEVSGDKREHARGDEGDQAREHGDEHGHPQCAVEDEPFGAHSLSASASATRVDRIDAAGSCPMIRAATLPCLSITRVVGVAWMGVTAAKASLVFPSTMSITLG